MVRSRRRQKATRGPYATQVKEVQGPVLNGRPPETARVRLDSNLEEKYLGRGLLGRPTAAPARV
jgi:hypothetical protein